MHATFDVKVLYLLLHTHYFIVKFVSQGFLFSGVDLGKAYTIPQQMRTEKLYAAVVLKVNNNQ
jgi:hypothetical protein